MNKDWRQLKENKQFLLGVAITMLAIILIYTYYLYGVFYPSTENAYVNANLITMSPKVGGYIKKVYVANNQHVKKGQLLLEIDPIDYTIAWQKAKESLSAAQLDKQLAQQQIKNSIANKVKAESNYQFAQQMAKRYTRLYQSKAGSLQNMQKYVNQCNQASLALDEANNSLIQAKTHFAIAKTNILSAKLMLKNAKLNVNDTRLVSPVDGYISNFNLRAGQLVSPGQKLFGLIDNHSWWIDVNLKETQLARIKKNQTAKIKLDMYRHHYHGRVESISYASGTTFSLLPAENASGNWVKVIQYFTVRVAVKNDPNYPLRVGASAEVQINTRS